MPFVVPQGARTTKGLTIQRFGATGFRVSIPSDRMPQILEFEKADVLVGTGPEQGQLAIKLGGSKYAIRQGSAGHRRDINISVALARMGYNLEDNLPANEPRYTYNEATKTFILWPGESREDEEVPEPASAG